MIRKTQNRICSVKCCVVEHISPDFKCSVCSAVYLWYELDQSSADSAGSSRGSHSVSRDGVHLQHSGCSTTGPAGLQRHLARGSERLPRCGPRVGQHPGAGVGQEGRGRRPFHQIRAKHRGFIFSTQLSHLGKGCGLSLKGGACTVYEWFHKPKSNTDLLINLSVSSQYFNLHDLHSLHSRRIFILGSFPCHQ